MASNQLNIHRKKSIVVNALFEELFEDLHEPQKAPIQPKKKE